MPQIINEGPGLGYRLGTGLGEGFSSAVNQLTQHHLQDLVQKKQAQAQIQQQRDTSLALQKSGLGLSPEDADLIASLPEKNRWEAAQTLRNSERAVAQQQGIGQTLSAGLAPQEQEPQQQEGGQQELLQALAGLGQQKIDPRMQALTGLTPSIGGQPLSNLAHLGPQQQPTPAPQGPQQGPGQQQPSTAAPVAEQQAQSEQSRAVGTSEPLTKKEIARPITAAERLDLRERLKEQKEQAKEDKKDQREFDKETKSYYEEVEKQGTAAYDNNKRLGRLLEIARDTKNPLPDPTYYKFLKETSEEGLGANAAMAGIALGTLIGGGSGTLLGPAGTAAGIQAGQVAGGAAGALGGYLFNPLAKYLSTAWLNSIKKGNPNIEEFEKLSNDFIRNAKEIFGARITDKDLALFMQTIPTLMQTDAGKKRIIANMKSFNEASQVRLNAMRQIIKENGGRRPQNLRTLVDEYSRPQLDKLTDAFIKGLHEPIPSGIHEPREGDSPTTRLVRQHINPGGLIRLNV